MIASERPQPGSKSGSKSTKPQLKKPAGSCAFKPLRFRLHGKQAIHRRPVKSTVLVKDKVDKVKPDGKRVALKSTSKFKGAPPLSSEARTAMQHNLKLAVKQCISNVGETGGKGTCFEAVGSLARVLGLDSDLVTGFCLQHFKNFNRKPEIQLLNVILGCEKGNDIYRLVARPRRTLVTVSNSTHGPSNVELCIKMLLICGIVGASTEELSSMKHELAKMV